MFPYTLELLVFSIAMIFGGRFQDRFGPRGGTLISGIFTGLALILCAVTASPLGITLSFGFLFGSAAAFGYSAVTPAVIKWFPPEKRGLVTGIVLMSLGAAALVWSPLINFLVLRIGVINSFLFCGMVILIIITSASRVIDLPKKGSSVESNAQTAQSGAGRRNWRANLKSPVFRILWVMIGLTSGVGFIFIGNLVQIAQLDFQVGWGYILVSLFALTNALGRVFGGALCDRIGYLGNFRAALFLMLLSMLLFLSGWNWPVLVIATSLLGLSYGSLYTSFPVIVGRLFGLEDFGLNYGMLFTAVGIVGSLSPLAAAYLAELTNSYYPAFLLGVAFTITGFFLVNELNERAGGQLNG